MKNLLPIDEWRTLLLSFAFRGSMFLLFLGYVCSPAEARKERTLPRGRLATSKKIDEAALKKDREKEKKKRELERVTAYVSPYATPEEILLPEEIGTLRRSFVTKEPLYFEGRLVEEQAIFEALARREDETLRYAIGAIEEKPWWRDLLESMSGVAQYGQGLYTNFFNDRARRRLTTEKGFFGGRMARRGVLSGDANYYVTLERLSYEHAISLDPHILKAHGGEARFLYKPSRRFHLLFLDGMGQTDKIVAVDERLGSITAAGGTGTGGHAISNRLGTEFRYFLTYRDVIDLTFNYDYSRAREGNELRMARGYRTKAAFIRSLGRRLLLRGFWSYDYLMTTNTSLKGVTFRHEPGLGGTFVLGKRLVLDLDYSRQYFRTRGLREKQQHGNQLDVRLNHALTRRARQGYIFRYSKLQGKRSATSKITKEDPATETREESPGAFESLTMGSQFSYNLTKLINLSVTFEYAWTDSGVPDSETNNRKRIIAELTRPFFANRVNLGLTYTFEKNDAAIPSSYLSHTLILGVRTTFGAGPKK